MSLKAVSMKNFAIINHNGNHYRVNFAFISKKDLLFASILRTCWITLFSANVLFMEKPLN